MNCSALPQFMEQCNVDLRTGKVKFIANRSFWVENSQGLHQAAKSVSCVVEPQIGDTVLLLAESEDRNFILSVLSRETEKPAEHSPELKFLNTGWEQAEKAAGFITTA